MSGGRSYVGYSNDVERRLFEHNVSESRGFTKRYRPWELIHRECFDLKSAAMARERYLKSGRGRVEVKEIVDRWLRR